MEAAALLLTPPTPEGRGLPSLRPKPNPKVERATKMIIQILPDSWILRVACNTVDPYTLPASHHIFFRINGIIKCDRNIKYSRAALGSNFEIRVVSDGPFSATSRCVHVRLIEIMALDI